jgi:signal transduction histidine kinase
MNKSKYLQILAWGIIAYMLLALVWWSILLVKKNEQSYLNQIALLSYQEAKVKPILEENLVSLDSYQELIADYRSQKRMIVGEGIVFGIILLIGLWLINNAYQRELSAAEKQKNFLLSVTHELKSPIASVKLILETFLKRNLEAKQIKDFSSDALMETDRLDHLVGNLLTSSKIEANYQYNFETNDFVLFLWDIINKYDQKHADFVFNRKSSRKSLDMKFDKEAMTLAFHNIYENAIKYSPKTKIIDSLVSIQNKKIIIEIQDQGIGVDSAEREKVFEKFYRIGSEEVRKSKGTGLGLFIARQFIQAHNGTIRLKPNQPHGSIFQIELPILI